MADRKWYLVYTSEVDTLEGIEGPYPDKETALFVQNAQLAVDELRATKMLTDTIEDQRYFVNYYYIVPLDFTLAELEQFERFHSGRATRDADG